jgi:ATP-dependent protease Clp ATPase subunit
MPSQNAKCRWCDKRHVEVEMIFGGPNDLWICIECIQLMMEIYEEKRDSNLIPPDAELRTSLRSKARSSETI